MKQYQVEAWLSQLQKIRATSYHRQAKLCNNARLNPDKATATQQQNVNSLVKVILHLIPYLCQNQRHTFMRIVIQRVTQASVTIDNKVKGEVGLGLLLLAGFTAEDTEEDLRWIANKAVQLRIFSDAEDKMNLSVQDVQGDLLVISQFTLFANTKKGNRPSYINAAPPALAIPLYERFVTLLEQAMGKEVQTGEFGADMKVALLNDGPVTIVMDSQNRDIF
jgi:D-tyrosyl-tRNA(Tyr) deacylase